MRQQNKKGQSWRELADYRVYLVTDRALCLGRTLREVVLAAVDGGATMVQLREKKADTREFLALARELVQALHPRGVPLLINDRVDIALAAGAAGVHVGQTDMPVEEARALLGSEAIIGLSVENERQLAEAQTLDLDYAAISPLFATPTKTDTAPPWGLEGLARACTESRLPLVAIGGIHAENASAVVQAGAQGLAVVSELCAASDPAAAARRLRSAF